jgi:5'-deoxynucleotidase
MRNIRRWGLMRNSIEENIQEHSHMTAVLAHALALIRRDIYGRACSPEKAAAAALYHDASEIITGDMPTPVKYLNGKITGAYKEVEEAAVMRLLDLLPAELRVSYKETISPTDAELNEIIKAADKLSAYIKCVEELRAGNHEFASAEKQIRAVLDASPLPEVKYFMEHFMPSFGMTLDELTADDR